MRLMIAAVAVVASFAQLTLAQKEVWTDPGAKDFPVSYSYQGEYSADGWGAQVIALNDHELQAVVYPGGLPGAGWDGTNKTLMHGVASKAFAAFLTAGGDRRYLAKDAAEFSATRKFPPTGQTEAEGFIRDGVLTLRRTSDGASVQLQATKREADSMGATPPVGAVVLFDGTNKDHWRDGRVDEKTKLLNTDGKDMLTKQKFNNYRMPPPPKSKFWGRKATFSRHFRAIKWTCRNKSSK